MNQGMIETAKTYGEQQNEIIKERSKYYFDKVKEALAPMPKGSWCDYTAYPFDGVMSFQFNVKLSEQQIDTVVDATGGLLYREETNDTGTLVLVNMLYLMKFDRL